MSDQKRDEKPSWDEAAEGRVDFVTTGKDYFRDAINNPATFNLIGEISGFSVLDLACGEGYNTRILAGKHAQVTGIDNSKKLLALAQSEEAKEPHGIEYLLRDAGSLDDVPNDNFELVTCFMALHDIENYDEAVEEVVRVLKPNGRFIFSIPHPCFETITVNGVTLNASQAYFEKIRDHTEWNMKRLSKQFTTVSYHRTLSDYSQALFKRGLMIVRFVEPQATPSLVEEYPVLKEVVKRPQSVIFEAVKHAT
jgi:ubiquinone/menaquinone biosynthesis C-methylase UbiE